MYLYSLFFLFLVFIFCILYLFFIFYFFTFYFDLGVAYRPVAALPIFFCALYSLVFVLNPPFGEWGGCIFPSIPNAKYKIHRSRLCERSEAI